MRATTVDPMTHHSYIISRKADKSSAWLVIHEVGQAQEIKTTATAWTTINAARRHIANQRGQSRIRLDKLSANEYRYIYTS